MNKSDLVTAIATNTTLSKKDSDMALTVALGSIIKALKDGEEVRLIGFGTFKVNRREAREGRNPSTGAPLHIAAVNVPAFKAGKELKQSVN